MANLPQTQIVGAPESALSAIYRDKPQSYFGNARHDIVAKLPVGAAVLELGCGAGGTGKAAIAAGKASRYVGLELSETAAAVAREHLTEVLVGDVEVLDLSGLLGQFDALIISEVLEHLTDPWTTLARLATCLKPGAIIFASSPNVAHWKVIQALIQGRFAYQDKGVMDRTHLRWFTPASYRALVEGAGLEVVSLEPVTPLRPKAKVINSLTGGRFRHLFMTQMMIVARKA